jgi:phosphatidylserine/phosphatidylglycerophosphate/cardiolipin synthase-like enzyme
VTNCGLLIDGRSYYKAFYEAALHAQRYVLIAGWRFNSDVRLVRGQDAEAIGGEVMFLPFLQDLCEQKPELRIFVLAWDFSINFARQWELFQAWKFNRAPHERLVFRFDNQHAIGASHHQKFVVIDGQTAFVGGLDFNADDWDDRSHLAHNPLRADSGQKPHDPYHDIQAYFTGPAAEELAKYFATRWQVACGEELKLPHPPTEPPAAIRPNVSISARQMAFCLNKPKTLADPTEVYEIRELYVDAIAAAEELIYIENQYFSSEVVLEALLRRLRKAGRPRLELVVVLPKRFPAWVETMTVGPPRIRMLDELRKAARKTGHRLGLYYTMAPAEDGREVNVVLHSKVLIVDDRFMTVGSCNTSNRSMGLDTELNVVWEAASEDGDLLRSIRRARVSLLAEHCGLRQDADVRRKLRRRKGLVAYLNRLAAGEAPRLRRLTHKAIIGDKEWLEQLVRWGFAFDPQTPMIENQLHDSLSPDANSLAAGVVAWFRKWLGRSRS